MAVSKKTRFEVFNRDEFRCQYCGQTPPSVVLEVDHVHAKSRGGSDDIDNLLTSCFDCNRGKAANPLEAVPEALAAKQARRREAMEQLAAFNELQAEERQRIDEQIDDLGRYWFAYFKRKGAYVFGPARRPSILGFVKRLPYEEVKEAIDIAMGRYLPFRGDDDRTFRYFCGICWRKIRERDPSSGGEQ